MNRNGRLKRSPMPPRKAGLASGAPLQRRTELGRGTKRLERATPLGRSSELKPSAKPLPAVNKERQARKVEAAGMPRGDVQDIVHARSGGWCELRIPGVCLGRATNIMHRKPEGQGGLYVPSNLLDGCGMGNVSGCHGYQENNRAESYGNGRLVRRKQDHRMRPVRMWIRGADGIYVEGNWLLDDMGDAVPAESNSGEAA